MLPFKKIHSLKLNINYTPFDFSRLIHPSNNNNEELIEFYNEIANRTEEFKDSEIISAIKNDKYTTTTKNVMVDLYSEKNKNADKKELKSLIKDKTVNNEIKAKIVSDSDFTKDDVKLLKQLIKVDNDLLGFTSLKKLNIVDKQEAFNIANDILSNVNSESVMRISSAQKVYSMYLHKSEDNDTKIKFINDTMKIIENSSTDSELYDSSFFALSDLQDKEATKKLLKSKQIKKELKVLLVNQNYIVLNDMLKNNPTEENIEIVISAMETLPIFDMFNDLKSVQNLIKNKELKTRCTNVLEDMKINGIESNPKYLVD